MKTKIYQEFYNGAWVDVLFRCDYPSDYAFKKAIKEAQTKVGSDIHRIVEGDVEIYTAKNLKGCKTTTKKPKSKSKKSAKRA